MKEQPGIEPKVKVGVKGLAAVTIAFYVAAVAFSAFAFVWFFVIRPPRSVEEFLLMWLIFFLGGTAIYYLLTRGH